MRSQPHSRENVWFCCCFPPFAQEMESRGTDKIQSVLSLKSVFNAVAQMLKRERKQRKMGERSGRKIRGEGLKSRERWMRQGKAEGWRWTDRGEVGRGG